MYWDTVGVFLPDAFGFGFPFFEGVFILELGFHSMSQLLRWSSGDVAGRDGREDLPCVVEVSRNWCALLRRMLEMFDAGCYVVVVCGEVGDDVLMVDDGWACRRARIIRLARHIM